MDVPAGVTQEEGHTRFIYLPSVVLALIFIARRIQQFLSLVVRVVYRILCTKTVFYAVVISHQKLSISDREKKSMS